MSGVLGLDLSTRPGVYYEREDGFVFYEAIKFELAKGMNAPEAELKRALAVSDYIVGLVEKYEPRLVVIEGYAFHAKGNAVSTLYQIGTLVRVSLVQLVPCFYIVSPTASKKFLTGTGKATKTQMKAAAKAAGFDNKSHDIVDAYALAQIGKNILKPNFSSLTKGQVQVVLGATYFSCHQVHSS